MFINWGVPENIDGFGNDWLGNQPRPANLVDKDFCNTPGHNNIKYKPTCKIRILKEYIQFQK